MEKMIFKIKYPSEILGLKSKKGVYGKESLSCNGYSDKNISYFVKKPLMEFLIILYKPLVHLLNCKAVNKHPKSKMSHFLENLRFFQND